MSTLGKRVYVKAYRGFESLPLRHSCIFTAFSLAAKASFPMINGVPRILILRLSAIGDVVRVLPALHAIRDLHPNAQIDWAVEPKSRDVVEGHPALDQVHVFERSADWLHSSREFIRFSRLLRQQRYDIVLDFHGIAKTGLLMRATRAKQRIAFAPPRSQEMSYLFATQKVSLVSARMNRVEENLELCKALGAKRHILDVTIDVPEDVEDTVHAYFIKTFHGAKRVVAMHIAVDRPEKQWPLQHFADLADMLLADGRFEVMLTWGPGQWEMAEEVRRLAHRNPVIAPELPDLKHYCALVQQADLYFGGDTGPMHLASAMDTPVVAVFGGTDPVRHGPMRQPNAILYRGLEPFPEGMSLSDAQEALSRVHPEEAYRTCVELIFPRRVPRGTSAQAPDPR